jgi:hypothetical protein
MRRKETMLHKTHDSDNQRAPEPCPTFPELVRMNYFHGQMLGARDFATQQTYHRVKHQLVNRCLLGHGVVCGLLLEALESKAPCPDPQGEERDRLEDEIDALEQKLANAQASDERARQQLEVTLEEAQRRRDEYGADAPQKSKQGQVALALTLGSGFALDPEGRELVVAQPGAFDLRQLLSPADREKLSRDGRAWLYVSICYAECGLEPTRPASLDACQITPGCQDARVRETYQLKASLDRPADDERCEPCCSEGCDACVLLARVRVRHGRPLRPRDVDNSVRRPFGLYAPTVITGVSWRHGDSYSPDEAEKLLGTGCEEGGLEIRFSRPIHVSSFKPGVLELLSFAGGRGVAGQITHVSGRFVDLPESGMVERVVYRDTTDERPRPGDRILVIVRCDFLLDACCRPVDGNHVGGRVRCFADCDDGGAQAQGKRDDEGHERAERQTSCASVPGRGGHFTSGNGTPGGTFESWFFIERDKESGV